MAPPTMTTTETTPPPAKRRSRVTFIPGPPSAPGEPTIYSLPNELYAEIISHLNAAEAIILSHVNRRFYSNVSPDKFKPTRTGILTIKFEQELRARRSLRSPRFLCTSCYRVRRFFHFTANQGRYYKLKSRYEDDEEVYDIGDRTCFDCYHLWPPKDPTDARIIMPNVTLTWFAGLSVSLHEPRSTWSYQLQFPRHPYQWPNNPAFVTPKEFTCLTAPDPKAPFRQEFIDSGILNVRVRKYFTKDMEVGFNELRRRLEELPEERDWKMKHMPNRGAAWFNEWLEMDVEMVEIERRLKEAGNLVAVFACEKVETERLKRGEWIRGS